MDSINYTENGNLNNSSYDRGTSGPSLYKMSPGASSSENIDPSEILRAHGYTPFGILGKGAHGQAYRVFSTKERKFYAAKIHQDEPDYQREKNILLKIHENPSSALISLKEIIENPDNAENEPSSGIYGLVVELGLSSLDEFITFMRLNNISWTEEALCGILWQLYQQISELRNLSIYHQDVKPMNIIITEDSKLKLIDFSLANSEPNKLTTSGTSGYRAPERYFHNMAKGLDAMEHAFDKDLLKKYFAENKCYPTDPFLADIYSIIVTVLECACLNRSDLQSMFNSIKDKYPKLYTLAYEIAWSRTVPSNLSAYEKHLQEFMEIHKPAFRVYFLEKYFEKHKENFFDYIDDFMQLCLYTDAEAWVNHKINEEKSDAYVMGNYKLILGYIYLRKYQFDTARLPLEEVLKLFRKSYLGQAACKNNLALALKSSGYNLHAAEKYYQEAAEVWESAQNYDKAAGAKNNQGKVLLSLRKYEDAEQCFNAALKLVKNNFIREEARTYLNYGDLYLAKKRFEKAKEMYQQALEIRRNNFPEHYEVALSYEAFLILYQDWPEAAEIMEILDYGQKAISIYQKWFGNKSLEVLNSMELLSKTLEAVQKKTLSSLNQNSGNFGKPNVYRNKNEALNDFGTIDPGSRQQNYNAVSPFVPVLSNIPKFNSLPIQDPKKIQNKITEEELRAKIAEHSKKRQECLKNNDFKGVITESYNLYECYKQGTFLNSAERFRKILELLYYMGTWILNAPNLQEKQKLRAQSDLQRFLRILNVNSRSNKILSYESEVRFYLGILSVNNHKPKFGLYQLDLALKLQKIRFKFLLKSILFQGKDLFRIIGDRKLLRCKETEVLTRRRKLLYLCFQQSQKLDLIKIPQRYKKKVLRSIKWFKDSIKQLIHINYNIGKSYDGLSRSLDAKTYYLNSLHYCQKYGREDRVAARIIQKLKT